MIRRKGNNRWKRRIGKIKGRRREMRGRRKVVRGNVFMEGHIPREEDRVSRNIKKFITLHPTGVSQKHTRDGSRFEFIHATFGASNIGKEPKRPQLIKKKGGYP